MMGIKPPSIEMLNMDCMAYMATCPDKAFDLAIVDPPYKANLSGGINPKNGFKSKSSWDKMKVWDSERPSSDYFKELFRVSRNQIIWGANYFAEHLPPSMGWVFWYKMQDSFSFSDGELAFTSFDSKTRIFKYARGNDSGFNTGCGFNNIHPTQKPIALYIWLLKNYAKPGQRIFDSHGGSFSSAIAAYYFGCDFVGCELDKEYFELAKARFERETRQTQLFDYENPADQPHQLPGSHGYDAVDCFAGH
jgi:site-specific DNA-methyltransferase (adenine-specific)